MIYCNLIDVPGTGIDIRYFPHFQSLEFYSEETDDEPFYIENIGDVVIFVRTSCGAIKLNPGERKQVVRSNAESDTPILSEGDLYPA